MADSPELAAGGGKGSHAVLAGPPCRRCCEVRVDGGEVLQVPEGVQVVTTDFISQVGPPSILWCQLLCSF